MSSRFVLDSLEGIELHHPDGTIERLHDKPADKAAQQKALVRHPSSKKDSKAISVMRLSSQRSTGLLSIYQYCLDNIGGENNGDVRWILYKRPKTITRKSFFESYTWAVWVAGMRRKSAETFLERAGEQGFRWDFIHMGSRTNAAWERFRTAVHGHPCPRRARAKWDAVRETAEYLRKLRTDAAFREECFDNKRRSAELNQDDVDNLTKGGWRFVGRANAQYIVRNMGGEAIKCDRWIMCFLRHYEIRLKELESNLKKLKIAASLFDAAIWGYCEKHVKSTRNFAAHFNKRFGSITL